MARQLPIFGRAFTFFVMFVFLVASTTVAATRKTKKSSAKSKKSAVSKKSSSKKAGPKKKTSAPAVASRPAPVETSSTSFEEDPAFPLGDDGRVLAAKLAQHWTRDAGRLVSTVEQALAEAESSAPITLVLAIAHAETNGKILDVSEAGAVGLAQATPIAYLTENLPGKLFVTEDYITGSRAYILKKPLHDADMIASVMAEGSSAEREAIARALLRSAFKYRREGVDELLVLAPYAEAGYMEAVEQSDADNLAVLEELERMIAEKKGRKEFAEFRDHVRSRYRSLRQVQKLSWTKYQVDLIARRNALLEKTFGEDASVVIKNRAYEAAELLAKELDDRFSPRSMAHFLNDHLQTKQGEAEQLGVREEELERYVAGLYNGGGHNIKRMIAGLIVELPETQNYMRKVPNMRSRLDEALATAHATQQPSAETVIGAK